MNEKRDYYEVLGIARNASDAEIKTNYRRLALKYHPDRNPGDTHAEERFKEAAEAYEVLRDPEKRRIYDRYGHAGLQGTGFQGFRGFEDIFSSFGDIFEGFLGLGGGSRSHRRVRKGADLQYDLRISFLEAASGVDKVLEVPRVEICPRCNGSGVKPGYHEEACRLCSGMGQVVRSQGFIRVSTPCPECRGSGVVVSHPCDECGGTGSVHVRKKLNVKIPAGVKSDMTLRLSGEGERSHSGGPRGDLYVRIHVDEHEFFERHEDDVICRVPISFVDAALGTTLEIPTLDGYEKIHISEGSQHGDVLRLRGKGFPRLAGLGKGDQVVVLDVRIPTKLSTKQQELLREFAGLEKEKREDNSHLWHIFSRGRNGNSFRGNPLN